MSKIFEAVSKDKLFDFQEISGDAAELPMTSADEVTPLDDLRPWAPPLEDLEGVEDVERVVSLRVSALAPLFPFDTEAHSAAAEQYRIIRTKILHSPNGPRLIVVSSPCSGDGKTITSINIAAFLSLKENMSVLLVDADFRRPAVAKLLGIPSVPGLAEVLSGHVSLNSALVRALGFSNLCILPAGDAGQSSAELLHSERWPAIIEQFRAQFDIVIIDTTPVGVVTDYELVQFVSDGVIIVVRPDHTDRKACLSALQSVPKEKFIGVVLNSVEDWWLWKAPDYDYSGKPNYRPEA